MTRVQSGSSERRLGDCSPGEGGTILRVAHDGTLGQRLMEMGLVEGTPVEVVRLAPLGDPMEVRVDDSRLSIRRSEACHIILIEA